MDDKQIEGEREKSFDEILKIEPELEKLKSEAIGYLNNSPGGYWERNRYWYRQLKPRFINLVGFMARNPELQTTEVYDTAYMGFVRILKL